MVNINQAYQQLTSQHQRELEDFAEFLLQREKKLISSRDDLRHLKMPGFASLKSMISDQNGVELQHQARDLRK